MSDVWNVRLSTGEVRTFNADQLDAAYKAGWIDETTPVKEPDAHGWMTLGELAGIEPEPAPYSIAPVALATTDFATPDFGVDVEVSELETAALRPSRAKWVFAFAAV